jgi:Fe-S cluster biogenesis protein NfuA|tara:strand:+ start:363 stop:758 length:396 start_codon:yes stop_codon:yes gene_type:complete
MSDRTKEEIIENINHIVANNIQPGVEMHGGVVKLKDFDMETGVALMLMSGACSGCASSSITLKLGVENMLKHYVPEVNAVEGVDDPEYNDPYYKEMPAYNSWENPGKSYDEMLDEMEEIEKKDKPNENDGS